MPYTTKTVLKTGNYGLRPVTYVSYKPTTYYKFGLQSAEQMERERYLWVCCDTHTGSVLCTSAPWKQACCCTNQTNSRWTFGRVVTAINLSTSFALLYCAGTQDFSSLVPGGNDAVGGAGLGLIGLNILVPIIHAVWIAYRSPTVTPPTERTLLV